VSYVDMAKILICDSARHDEIFARIPAEEKSNGPIILKHDQPSSDFSDFILMAESHNIESSSSVLLMVKKSLS